MQKHKLDSVFILITGSLLIFSLSSAVISTTDLSQQMIPLFFVSFLAIGLFWLAFLNKFTMIFLGAILLFFGLIVLHNGLTFEIDPANPAIIPIYAQIRNFFVEVFRYIVGFGFGAENEAAIRFGIVFIISAFVFSFGHIFLSFFMLLGLSMLVFALVLSTGVFTFNTSFYIFIIAISAFLIKRMNAQSLGRSKASSVFSLYALPIAAICLSLALAIPRPPAGFSDAVVRAVADQPFQNANIALQDAFRARHFSLSQTGFGGSNQRQLGGNVSPDYGIFMRLNSEERLYLSGIILDYYTGSAWVNTLGDIREIDFSQIYDNLDFFERQTALLTAFADLGYFDAYREMRQIMRELTPQSFIQDNQGLIRQNRVVQNWYIQPGPYFNYQMPQRLWLQATLPLHLFASRDVYYEDFFNPNFIERTFHIDTHNFSTFTVFTGGILANASHITNYDGDFLIDSAGNVQSSALMGRGSVYSISHIELDFSRLNLGAILSYSRAGLLQDVYARYSYAVLNEGFNSEYLTFYNNGIYITYGQLLRDYLLPRSNFIREHYLQLPEDFPERIREYALYITDVAENDLQIAFMLEQYLRNNFEYTLEPGPTPSNRDFVDYFLFDLRRGYCTAYATAFVTMARSLGLPARYVEGFIVTGNRDYYGYFNVLNRNGHAWGEVYFEGFGWLRFEPTPPEELLTTSGLAAAPGLTGPSNFGGNFTDSGLASAISAAAMSELMARNEAEGGDMGIRHFTLPDDWFIDEWAIYEDFFWDFEANPISPNVPFYQQHILEEYQYEESAASMTITEALIYAFYMALGLVFAALIARLLYIEIMLRSKKPKNNREAVIFSFYKIVKYMKFFDYEIMPNETAKAFAERVSKRVGFENDRVFMVDIAEIFARARYSNMDIIDYERDLLISAEKSLNIRVKRYLGRPQYLFHKYIGGSLLI